MCNVYKIKFIVMSTSYFDKFILLKNHSGSGVEDIPENCRKFSSQVECIFHPFFLV